MWNHRLCRRSLYFKKEVVVPLEGCLVCAHVAAGLVVFGGWRVVHGSWAQGWAVFPLALLSAFHPAAWCCCTKILLLANIGLSSKSKHFQEKTWVSLSPFPHFSALCAVVLWDGFRVSAPCILLRFLCQLDNCSAAFLGSHRASSSSEPSAVLLNLALWQDGFQGFPTSASSSMRFLIFRYPSLESPPAPIIQLYTKLPFS